MHPSPPPDATPETDPARTRSSGPDSAPDPGPAAGVELPAPVPVEAPVSGTNVLVVGEGAGALSRRVLAALRRRAGDPGRRATVAVTTRAPALSVADRLLGRGRGRPGPPVRGPVAVVDATPGASADDGPLRWSVRSPAALPSVAAAVASAREALAHRGFGPDAVDFLFDSPAAAFRQVGDRAGPFLHGHTVGRGVGAFVVPRPWTEASWVDGVAGVFDGAVECRRRGGRPQVRYRGFGGGPTAWSDADAGAAGSPAASD